ncbi:MAG: ATP-binding protein [Candidatus Freyarchaeota archaeon]|nr:ATP-binding protein [Candidatus Jordarchaeia archaeon]MBS7269634.1 ATP-binding protein [Candidatus Jordarchaeia archaeon]MBS7280417.1 ATP-binding protein [Candidatus Jordarchaeia archaeon]
MANAYQKSFENMNEEIRQAREAYERYLNTGRPNEKEKAIYHYNRAKEAAQFCHDNGPTLLRDGFRKLIRRIDNRLDELKAKSAPPKTWEAPPRRPGGAVPLNQALESVPEDLRAIIEGTIVEGMQSVSLDEIAGLEDAKRALEEAVKLPLVRPDLFTGARFGWKGVLLFGPPGCGKTLLARAVAGDSSANFFNVSSAELVSKWLGEGEKIAKEVFRLAREAQPSIIFFDEVDAIARKRSTDEHDAVQRMKTILMQEMSGLNSQKEDLVIVIGATNIPWEIDAAFRRRFEKRIYIPLPDQPARREIFKIHTKGVELDSTVNFDELAKISEGYSGADISVICREALMAPIRELRDQGKINDPNSKPRPVSGRDFANAFAKIKPSVSKEDIEKHLVWAAEFKSV